MELGPRKPYHAWPNSIYDALAGQPSYVARDLDSANSANKPFSGTVLFVLHLGILSYLLLSSCAKAVDNFCTVWWQHGCMWKTEV